MVSFLALQATKKTDIPSPRTHPDCSSSSLVSATGAQIVIDELRKPEMNALKRLLLEHNALGDEGLELIMNYLCTEDGRTLPIEEINLNVTGMGDVALNAVSKYLEGNQKLIELHLLHNHLEGNSSSASRFVVAINSSSLRSLSLSYDSPTSGDLAAEFLSKLDSPHLRELEFFSYYLTTKLEPALAYYLRSTACLPFHSLRISAQCIMPCYLRSQRFKGGDREAKLLIYSR